MVCQEKNPLYFTPPLKLNTNHCFHCYFTYVGFVRFYRALGVFIHHIPWIWYDNVSALAIATNHVQGWYMYKNSNQFKIVIQEIWKVNIILVLIISDIFSQGLIFSTFYSIKEQTNAYLIVNMPISLSGDVNIIDDSCTTQPVDT